MKRGFYVTIAETGKYYGKTPFNVGGIVKLSKERKNECDNVTLPLLGVIGCLAPEGDSLVQVTMGVNKIYDMLGKHAYAQILFVSDFTVIAKILRTKDVEETPFLKAYRRRKKQ